MTTIDHDQMSERELLTWAKRQQSPNESHGRVAAAVLALFTRAERAEAKSAVLGGEWCAQNRAEGRGPCGACAWCCAQERARVEAAEAKLAEAERERDQAWAEEEKRDRDASEWFRASESYRAKLATAEAYAATFEEAVKLAEHRVLDTEAKLAEAERELTRWRSTGPAAIQATAREALRAESRKKALQARVEALEKALREGAAVLRPLVEHPERNPHAIKAPGDCRCRWCIASQWLRNINAALAAGKEPVCSLCGQPDRAGGHPECAAKTRAIAAGKEGP